MNIIIESVNTFGVQMRQSIMSPTSNIPILRIRGSLESRFHKHIRLMDEHGNTIDPARLAA